MSDLAERLARTLVKADSGGLSDIQVANFLQIYDEQVPDSIKADSQARDKLLEASKHIARDLDGYDMPKVTVTVKDFSFNPPSIQSELPCQLQFRLQPSCSKQQITVLDSNCSKPVATSGMLFGGDTFTAVICDPGNYTFTSEVFPFMSGQLTTAAKSAAASQLSVRAGPQDQQQSPHFNGLHGLDTGTHYAGNVALHEVEASASAAFGANTVTTLGALRRQSDASDGLSHQPSELAVLELTAAVATKQGHDADGAAAAVPAAKQVPSIATSPDLSRAGRWARRITAYDDSLDGSSHMSSSLHPSAGQMQAESNQGATDAATAEPAAATSHFSVLSSSCRDSSDVHVSAAAAVASATAAAPGADSVCGLSMRHACSSDDKAGSRCSNFEATADAEAQDMDVDCDTFTERQQQQQCNDRLPMIDFAKGLEGLMLGSGPMSIAAPGSPHALRLSASRTAADINNAEAAVGSAGTSPQSQSLADVQCCPAGSDDAEDEDDAADYYERLASDSDHSSASSDAEQHGTDPHHSSLARRTRRTASDEGTSLLGCQSWQERNSGSMRRIRAWGNNGSASEDDEDSSSDEAAGDVRLRTVHKQQQCSREDEDVLLMMEDFEESVSDGEDPTISRAAALAVQRMAAQAAKEAEQALLAGSSSSSSMHTAKASAQISPSAGPPGGCWSIGGRAFAAGAGVKSTFASTGHAPLAAKDAKDSCSISSGSTAWTVIGDKESSAGTARYSSLAAATSAVAAAAERKLGSSYFDKFTGSNSTSSSSRLHVASDMSKHAASSGVGTLLGPGKHVIGQQKLQPRTVNGTSSGVDDDSIDDPAAQYARLQELRKAQKLRNKLHLQQLKERDGSDSGADDMPPLRARVEQQRQLRQRAAAAAAALEHSTAAGSAAASNASSKKKKSRGKAGTGHATAPPAVADAATAAASRAAAEAKRRERDHLECALWDRGGDSKGESEDESCEGSRPSTSALSSSVSCQPDAPKQLSKCKFKTCKLTFSAELNKHRCHMSHLPSARNATTKTFKTEVLAFMRALPSAALAQLLHLPEPASLPDKAEMTQQVQHSSKASRLSSSSAAATTARSAAEAIASAAAVQRLQRGKLSDAWLNTSLSAAADSADAAAITQPVRLSELAKLCCGTHAEDEQHAPLLESSHTAAGKQQDAEQQQQQEDTKAEQTAASALAAAYVTGLRGTCCPSCNDSSSTTVCSASTIMSCCCRCHPASSDSAQQWRLPELDHIVSLLERASEGTWLCNPRLLQQAHPAGCSCCVCVGLLPAVNGSSGAAAAAAAWSPEAVMSSITTGLDVLDVLGDWGVDDASLSYAVERRIVTAFYKAKDAEAARIMSQLLAEDQPAAAGSNTKPGSSSADHSHSSAHQLPASAVAAAHGAASTKAAGKKKDRKKAAKAARAARAAAHSAASRKVPAWKAAGSEDDSSNNSDTETKAPAVADDDDGDVLPVPPLVTETAVGPGSSSLAGLVGPAGRLSGSRSIVFADKPSLNKQAVFDSPSKGRQVAEQLLQARLLQQDEQLNQLRQLKQQTQQLDQQRAAKQQQQQQHIVDARQRQQQQHAKPSISVTEQSRPTKQQQQQQQGSSARKPPVAAASAVKTARSAAPDVRVVSRASMGDRGAQQQQVTKQPALQHEQVTKHQVKQHSVIESNEASAAGSRPSSSGSSRSTSSRKGYAAVASQPTATPQLPTSGQGIVGLAAEQRAVLQEAPQQQQQQPAQQTRHAAVLPAGEAGGDELHHRQACAASGAVQQHQPNASGEKHIQSIAALQPARPGAVAAGPAAVPHPALKHELRLTIPEASDSNVSSRSTSPALASGNDAAAVAVLAQHTGQLANAQLQSQQPPPPTTTVAATAMYSQQPAAWQQQQHAVLLHQHWLAAAHQRAVHDMLIYSGRAATAAAGQELVPFTPQEQQYIAHWTQYYYYQQAYMGLAATQQQQHAPAAAAAVLRPADGDAAKPAQLPLSTTGTNSNWSQQQQQQQCVVNLSDHSSSVEAAGPSVQQREQAQQTQHADVQQANSPAFQLQFGSFPAQFEFSSPAGSPVKEASKGGPPADMSFPGPSASTQGTAVSAIAEQSRPPAVQLQRQCNEQQQECLQQQQQQHTCMPAGSAQQCQMYWWAYQQQLAQLAYLQQQQQHQVVCQQQGAPVDMAACQEQQFQHTAPNSAGPTHHWQQQGSCQGAAQQQPVSKFVADLASAVGAEAASISSSSRQQPGGAQHMHSFNARVASELLDSRWNAVVPQYGEPQRQLQLPAAALAAGHPAEQHSAAVVAAPNSGEDQPAAPDGECEQHAQQQYQRQHGSSRPRGGGHRQHTTHSGRGSSKASGSGVWRVRQR